MARRKSSHFFRCQALTAIAAHHGRPYDMNELHAKFAISMRGISLGDLTQLAGALGLRARPLRLGHESLRGVDPLRARKTDAS